jgi:2'-5' RNA ligase
MLLSHSLKEGDVMRVFIGVEFSKEVKDYLDDITTHIKKDTVKGVFTSNNNLHLTIRYIGEISDIRQESIKDVIDIVCSKSSPFEIKIGGIGKFHKGHGSIVWVGLQQGKNALKALYNKLEEELVGHNFEKEERLYRPHITIGKKVMFKNPHNIVFPPYPRTITITHVTLFESHRVNGVLTYTPIYSGML